MTQHQRIVAHPKKVFEQGFVMRADLPHHIAPTSSGMSKKVGWR